MFTHLSPQDITIPMVHISVQDSHTCCLWFTQNTDPRGLPTSLYQGTVIALYLISRLHFKQKINGYQMVLLCTVNDHIDVLGVCLVLEARAGVLNR